ncbi:MAG: GNAT family N-acetyltransferase [Muribaculaceae bacterium]|nr:GNAT family N-acetyltransferase [Muribaculaceae bacterium]
MTIRKTLESDLPAVMALFDDARRYMRAEGNLGQWTDGYPSEEIIRQDISRGGSYVCTDADNNVVGTFFFVAENEPTYARIYGGSWPNNLPYGVIHRIASNGRVSHLLHRVLDFCFTLTDVIRIDTHRDNRTMIRGLSAYGFQYCGIIHLANGDERMAYIKCRNSANE